ELFGHVAGAFTDAKRNYNGLVRDAKGGTLFLDEVGELPLNVQAKLLRLLEQKTVRPVGATAELQVDFRLVAATNRNLRDLVKKGQFREDLYFRLKHARITLAPLRERREDVRLLV